MRPHFDPSNIQTVICCIHCKRPLWKMKILAHQDNVPISTETLPIGSDVPKYSDSVPVDCPDCMIPFFTDDGKKKTILCKDPTTGASFTL